MAQVMSLSPTQVVTETLLEVSRCVHDLHLLDVVFQLLSGVLLCEKMSSSIGPVSSSSSSSSKKPGRMSHSSSGTSGNRGKCIVLMDIFNIVCLSWTFTNNFKPHLLALHQETLVDLYHWWSCMESQVHHSTLIVQEPQKEKQCVCCEKLQVLERYHIVTICSSGSRVRSHGMLVTKKFLLVDCLVWKWRGHQCWTHDQTHWHCVSTLVELFLNNQDEQKAFCASILAKCCNAKIDEGSCRACMAPSCAWSSSDMSEATPRGARPSTHWDGEKPPTRAESFFTLSTCVMHDSTCSLVQAPTSVHTRLKRAFNKPPCLSTRPNDSGLSRGTWCTWMLCSSTYCCKTPRLCKPRSHMIATGCPAQLNQRLISASKQDREEAWPAPTFTTSACWKQVPMQTMLRTWYFCPVTSVNSSTSIPKVWLNV